MSWSYNLLLTASSEGTWQYNRWNVRTTASNPEELSTVNNSRESLHSNILNKMSSLQDLKQPRWCHSVKYHCRFVGSQTDETVSTTGLSIVKFITQGWSRHTNVPYFSWRHLGPSDSRVTSLWITLKSSIFSGKEHILWLVLFPNYIHNLSSTFRKGKYWIVFKLTNKTICAIFMFTNPLFLDIFWSIYHYFNWYLS